MPNNAIQQNTQLCMYNAKLLEANRECSRESIRPEATKTKILDMTHPEFSYGGAMELDDFLDTLRSNFRTHERLFPHGDHDKVKPAASLLSTSNNHPDLAHRQTQMIDPVEWLRELWRDWDPCSEDFEAFSEAMQKMYGDKDRELKRGKEVYNRHPPRSEWTGESLHQSNRSKLDSSGMAPAG